MSTDQTPDTTPDDEQDTAPPRETPRQQDAPAEQDPARWDGKIESLDPRVQKMIRDLRGEAASTRKRADDTAQEIARAVAKAAGLTLPGDEQTVDTDALTANLSKATAARRDSAVQLAVYQAAGKAGLSADAMLDSRSFMATLADADPDSADFSATIESAVTDAATAGKFRSGRAPAASTVDGPTGSGGPVSPTAFAAMSMAERAKVQRDDPAAYRNLTGR